VTATHPTPGRPRDPDVDRRIAQAALDLFGDAGWAGFAMEAVARRAGVGKASLYLRWSSKEALLVDALSLRMARVSDVDTGTLRGDLIELAVQMLDLYAGPASRAALRLSLEAGAISGVAEHYKDGQRSQVLAARAIVRRGIERGELARDTPVTLLLDTLAGGAMMHALTTPADHRASLTRDIRAHAEALVSFLLRAVSAPLPAGGRVKRGGDGPDARSACLDDCWRVEVGGHLRGAVGHRHEHSVAAVGAPDHHGRVDGHEEAAVARSHVVAPAVIERVPADAVVLDECPVIADEEVAFTRAAALWLERAAEEVGDVAGTYAQLHGLPVDYGQRPGPSVGGEKHVVEPVVAVHRSAR